ncbi:MAG: DUF192 domain-containing protein [Halobacteriales archaeon]|nr:DUF192 domain-containing protein [Halobacteriales archaeon]
MVTVSRRSVIVLAALGSIVLLAAGIMFGPTLLSSDEVSPDLTAAERATVDILGPDETVRGTLEVRLATTSQERYTGLSDTASLGPNEGMLFVHETMGEYAYVMRDMDFPIDIVFVDTDGRITRIHHAETEEPPLQRYRGRGIWVLETPFHWTTDHDVLVGDRVRIRSVRG